MKKRYQIDKQRATDRFRKEAGGSNQDIQFALSLPEVLALAQDGLDGLMKLVLAAFTKLAEEMMWWEVGNLVGPRNKADAAREYMRWGSETGYCLVGGQKAPLDSPRVRDVRKREVSLGSYEVLQRASLMEDAVWNKIVVGLTTRRYAEVVRELEESLPALGRKRSPLGRVEMEPLAWLSRVADSGQSTGTRNCSSHSCSSRQRGMIAMGAVAGFNGKAGILIPHSSTFQNVSPRESNYILRTTRGTLPTHPVQ